jgi:acyl-CoA synthetase (AMP-forming)/AMP-acid ligase II
MLAARARRDPEKEAFSFNGKSVSWETLWHHIRVCAGHLVQQDVSRGDRVILALPNGPEFLAWFYGVQRAGGIAVPTFPGSGPRRLEMLAKRCDARVIVAEQLPTSGATETDSSPRPHYLAADSARARAESVASDLSGRAPEPDDLAYIQFTSGTTGDPKGVQLSHANVLENIDQLIAGFEITADDVFVSWLPAYHDMGLVLMTMVPLSLGARLILLPASLRSLRPWLEAIAEHRGTFTASPDFGYRAALRLVRAPRPDLSSLRVALNAAEPVRAGTIESFERTFDLDAVMIAGYGLAEATVGVSAWTPQNPPKIDAAGNVSVGEPFPHVEVAILGENELLEPNQQGEILVRSPANTRGYWGIDDPNEQPFWDEGFIKTGDLGYLDDDGDLFIVARLKQMIIQAGRNIAPREVEEIVDAQPFVRRSAAVGIDRGDEAGEQLYVFVEMRAGARPRDGECRGRVVAIVEAIHRDLGLRPGRVYLTSPRTIPFTPNGKVRYGQLKRAYNSGRLRDEGKLWYPEW